MKFRYNLLAITLISSACSLGAITVINPVSQGDSANGAADTIFTIVYDATGATKLVVTASAEGSGLAPGAVTFGSQNLVLASSGSNGAQSASVFFLDGLLNPTGTITITYAADQGSFFLSAFGLIGAAGGFEAANGSATQNSGTLAGAGAGSLVVGSFASNRTGGADIAPSDGPNGEITTTVFSGDPGGSGGGEHASGYFTASMAGDTSIGFTGGGTRPTTAGVAFAVPEPSAASLGLIASVLLLGRRSRG